MNEELSGGPAAGGVSPKVCRALCGVDVGLSAALSVLSWLMLHSWLRGEFWWAKLNVAGACFYGPEVYAMGVGRATLAGFALLLVIYTALGGLFALVARSEGFSANLLMALGWAAVWHAAAQRWLWPGLDAFGPSYFPALVTVPAHLLAALCLARFGSRYRSLALSFGDPEWAAGLAEARPEAVPQGREQALQRVDAEAAAGAEPEPRIEPAGGKDERAIVE